MDENMTTGITVAMNEGADIILEEQRRLVPPSADVVYAKERPNAAPRAKGRLKSVIRRWPVNVTKKGQFQVRTGYDLTVKNAKGEPEYIEAIFAEFGRRDGTVKKEGARQGTRVGAMAAKSHIRAGYDNKVDAAVDKTIEALDEVLNKWG